MFNVIDQTEDLLLKLYKITSKPGIFIKQDKIYNTLDINISDQDKIKEINYMLDDVLMNSSGYLESQRSGSAKKYKITPKGFSFLYECFHKQKESNIVFCAMWFNEKTERVWSKAMKPAVKKSDCKPIRIDQEHFTEDIIAQMLLYINKSRLVIADLTGGRGGVYFEAGYAKARGLPVIFTCNATEWESSKPHFDVTHFPFILWDEEDIEAFKKELYSRIINILF